MYRIRPYYEYIQTELIEFIKSAPEQWQAKVLACLSFTVIYSFEEISSKTNLSPIFILKALIASEKYNITIYCNDGWLMNKKLNADDLNDYLNIDIADYDVEHDRRMKRLIDGQPLSNKSVATKEPILTEKEKTQSADILVKPIKPQNRRNVSYLDTFDEIKSDRPVDGSGRKKSEEWNQSTSLDFGRAIRETIQKKNEEQLSPKTQPSEKKHKHGGASLDSKRSEQLFAKLCTLYPEYDAYITRHHKKDPSCKMMKLIEKKIQEDYLEDEKEA